ncbi:MAG: hypothetical protein [Bacteriophage sp.]|nr:MAG: hypothetical protein [Bacteriophage sp.]
MLYETLVIWLPTVWDLAIILIGLYFIYRLSDEWSRDVDHMRHDEIAYGKVLQATLKQYNQTKWVWILLVVVVAIKVHNFHL